MKLGTTLTVTKDCRLVGCEKGECIQQGPIYTCKQSEYTKDLFHINIVLKEISTFVIFGFLNHSLELFHEIISDLHQSYYIKMI
jgi:hypothetical protein